MSREQELKEKLQSDSLRAIIFDWGGVLAPSDNKIAAVRLKKSFDIDVIIRKWIFNAKCPALLHKLFSVIFAKACPHRIFR